jgi:hypothetical protein
MSLQESKNLSNLLSSVGISGSGEQQSIIQNLSDMWQAAGGQGSFMDFAKGALDSMTGGEGGLADLGKLAKTGFEQFSGTMGLLGPSTGLYSFGEGSQAAMLAAQNMGFGAEGTALTKEALQSAMGGAESSLSSLGSDALSFLSSPAGMGIVAGIGTYFMADDDRMKQGLTVGAATALGAQLGSVGGPIGTLVGGAIGGLLGGTVGSMFGWGEPAKMDSKLITTTSMDDIKGGIGVESAFGITGFSQKGTRHWDKRKPYKTMFTQVGKIDDLVAGALEPEEVEAVKAALIERGTYRKERNEGGISAKKVFRSIMKDRMAVLEGVLGPERYAQLGLDGMYQGILGSV